MIANYIRIQWNNCNLGQKALEINNSDNKNIEVTAI